MRPDWRLGPPKQSSQAVMAHLLRVVAPMEDRHVLLQATTGSCPGTVAGGLATLSSDPTACCSAHRRPLSQSRFDGPGGYRIRVVHHPIDTASPAADRSIAVMDCVDGKRRPHLSGDSNSDPL